MTDHTCVYTSDRAEQYLTFGNLKCTCGRVKPYQKPVPTFSYQAFVHNRDRHPGSHAESFWFFRLPIPEAR